MKAYQSSVIYTLCLKTAPCLFFQ